MSSMRPCLLRAASRSKQTDFESEARSCRCACSTCPCHIHLRQRSQTRRHRCASSAPGKADAYTRTCSARSRSSERRHARMRRLPATGSSFGILERACACTCQRMLVASAGSERRCRARVAASAPRSVGLEERNGFPGVLCALALHDEAHHIRLPRGAHALERSILHADVGRRRSSDMQERGRASGRGTDPARRVAGLDLGVKPLKKDTDVCILLPHAPLGSRLPRGGSRRAGCGAACKAPMPAHRPHRLARQRPSVRTRPTRRPPRLRFSRGESRRGLLRIPCFSAPSLAGHAPQEMARRCCRQPVACGPRAGPHRSGGEVNSARPHPSIPQGFMLFILFFCFLYNPLLLRARYPGGRR
jgi:hypothetical protein